MSKISDEELKDFLNLKTNLVMRPIFEELLSLRAQVKALGEENKRISAEVIVWLLKPAKRIFTGLEQGISTVPNSFPHADLKIGIERVEKALGIVERKGEGENG